MHQFMLGRYRMPVTCTLPDGSLIEREEGVVFRSAHDKAGFPVIRATFFGIEAPDAVRCYNLVDARLPDRRGSLFVTFPAIYRPDLGVRDFRRVLLSGPIEFHVISGRMELREIGAEPGAEPQHVRFDDGDAKLVIANVTPFSDGDKLLTPHAPRPTAADPGPRRFRLQVDGPGDFSFRGYYLQDRKRTRN